MSQPTYVTDCPNCGAELVHHVGNPHSCPWQCNGCARGWWPAELHEEARLHWRPDYADHGHGEHIQRLHDRRQDELERAKARGTSVLPEHVSRLTKAQLQTLVVRLTARSVVPEAYELLRLVQQALAGMP